MPARDEEIHHRRRQRQQFTMLNHIHKVVRGLDLLLRIPPLIAIDELLKSKVASTSLDISYDVAEDSEKPLMDYHFIFIAAVKFICVTVGCVIALCIFMLWTKNLLKVYMHIASIFIISLSYWINVNHFASLLGLTSVSQWDVNGDIDILQLRSFGFYEHYSGNITLNQSLLLQAVLAVLFSFVYRGPHPLLVQRMSPILFLAPCLLNDMVGPISQPYYSALGCTVFPLILAVFITWANVIPASQNLQSGYRHIHSMLSNFGMATFVETEWTRLNVPFVLLMFWLIRVSKHAAFLISDHLHSGVYTPLPDLMLQMAKALLVGGCNTLTALLGMTSVVSYLCYYLGCLFQWALLAEEDEEKPIGTVSAMLFYILALQAGLTSCSPDERLVRLSRNFCLLFTALLHFVHNYVHPLLLSLSASHNPALHRHLRALGVAVFIIVFPVTLLIFLWSHHSLSTWLLAVSAFSIEVIVKVIVSLMIYSLFLLDAYRSTFWEKLDDYVYYIRAFGNVVEFSFGILLFVNSAWVLVFEAGGAVRAVLVGIHAYFNIWCDAQAGWRVFMKRRTAVNKINSLPEATLQQLQSLNDVCSICYSEMRSAKITRCNHFFHGVCLRKWLYIQDRCPLCHDILYRVSSQDQILL